MADFVNPVTTSIVLSASDMPAPWVVCTRADATTWGAIPTQYRKWVTDHIEEMTEAEKFPLRKIAAIRALVAEVNRVGSINYPPETEARLRCMREEAYRRGLANRAAYIETGFAWNDVMVSDYITRRAALDSATTQAQIDAVNLSLAEHEESDPAISVTAAMRIGD